MQRKTSFLNVFSRNCDFLLGEISITWLWHINTFFTWKILYTYWLTVRSRVPSKCMQLQGTKWREEYACKRLGNIARIKCSNHGWLQYETKIKSVCLFIFFFKLQREHLKIAQQYFQLVGGSASECGKDFVLYNEQRFVYLIQ